MDNLDLSTVVLESDDVTHCVELSKGAGWNQTAEDWHFHLRVGMGMGLKTGQGELIATGVMLPVEEDLGWLAMVLVAPAWRRKGLARRVVEGIIANSPFHRLALDATEVGRGLYDSLGFRPVEEIVRYRLSRNVGRSRCPVTSFVREGTSFRGVAELLAGRSDVTELQAGSASALVRPGLAAIHVGPLVGGSEADAESLVRALLSDSEGDLLLDVPARAGTFCRRLERLGFQAERAFTRMSRGRAYLASPGAFATAGPEYG
ncbi:MAG TPA: GNAT family N-acetyltransferase [Rhodothermales bacterium]|nr:GNAT family N-acetyltransferase [Rhodothermales bacterium]